MKALFFTAALVLAAPHAFAHAMLEHAAPGAGATVAVAPKAVTLQFSENLEPAFSGIAVTGASGRSVAAGAATAHGNTMSVPLEALPDGTYHVAWHALSVDTHRTQGSFTFTVRLGAK